MEKIAFKTSEETAAFIVVLRMMVGEDATKKYIHSAERTDDGFTINLAEPLPIAIRDGIKAGIQAYKKEHPEAFGKTLEEYEKEKSPDEPLKPLVELVCPTCNKVLVGHTNFTPQPTNAEPQVGDISVCLYCTSVSIVTKEMKTRLMTDEERSEFALSDPVLSAQIQAAISLIKTRMSVIRQSALDKDD